MASKQYEIAFKLAAKMSSEFPKSFTRASSVVDDLEERLQSLNSEGAKIAGLVSARKAVAESSREYALARRKVEELGKALSKSTQPTKELVQGFNSAKQALGKAEMSLRRNREALNQLDAQAGTASVSLTSLVKRQKEIEEATKEATKAQEQQAKLQKRIEKWQGRQAMVEELSGDTNGIVKAAKTVGSYGTSAVVGAGTVMLKIGANLQAAMARVQAATGASAEEMSRIEASARSIYQSGMGESFDEVAKAMATIRQIGGHDGKDLEAATNNALALSKTFDMDVSESTRAASALMKNFGIDGEKAYDIIAYAARNGANRNGDLLDTLNEYSNQYKALGFSADQFAAHLIKGAQDGAFSIDKVGDAIKEFNIRAKDGSKTSMEAFDALGLSGTKATQMFAAGGKSAQMAFGEVVKRLQEMKDPVQRNAVGVALFGTQFEDLQDKALSSFAAMQGELPRVDGAMKSVSSTISSDLGTQISVVARSFQDLLIPASSEAARALSAQMPQIQASIAALSPHVTALGQSFVSLIPTLTQMMSSLIARVTNVATAVLENFDTIANGVNFVIWALFGLRTALLVTKVFVTTSKWIAIARAAFIQYRVAAIASAVASKVSAVALGVLSIASKGAGAAMSALSIVAKGLGTAMRFLAANPVVMILTAIAAASVLVYKNWDKLKEYALSISVVVAEAWQGAMESVKSVFSVAFSSLAEIMKAPINTIIAMINSVIESVNGMNFSVPDWVPVIGGQKFAFELPKIPQLAEGGIATQPTLATIAEAGEAEAVIPLSKLSTMLKPLPATAQSTGTTPMTINFAPVITVQGGGSAGETIMSATRSACDEFDSHMQRWLQKNRRVSFA